MDIIIEDELEYTKEQIDQAKQLEIEAVKKAEAKEYDSATSLFESALKVTPNNPSLYNNRQVPVVHTL